MVNNSGELPSESILNVSTRPFRGGMSRENVGCSSAILLKVNNIQIVLTGPSRIRTAKTVANCEHHMNEQSPL
jgi:hypothetical protein